VTQAIFAALPVSLTKLNLRDTCVEDGASGALARLTRLTTLNLSETQVTDAIAAELPVSLTSLSLAQNDISTAGVGALARLTGMILLDISYCTRVDLSSGIRLPRLEMLKASGLSVESLSAFDGTPSLSTVMVHLQEEGTIDIYIHLYETYIKSPDNTNWTVKATNGHWIDINPDGSVMI
jgi:Leucine-rich repeat (LRR) protein